MIVEYGTEFQRLASNRELPAGGAWGEWGDLFPLSPVLWHHVWPLWARIPPKLHVIGLCFQSPTGRSTQGLSGGQCAGTLILPPLPPPRPAMAGAPKHSVQGHPEPGWPSVTIWVPRSLRPALMSFQAQPPSLSSSMLPLLGN